MPKLKVTGQRSKSCLSNSSKSAEANFTNFHGKIEHNKKVCHAQELGLYAQGQGHNQVKSCLSNSSKTTEANLTKLHRKIEHYQTVCPVQEIGSYAQGQGLNQVKIMSQQ